MPINNYTPTEVLESAFRDWKNYQLLAGSSRLDFFAQQGMTIAPEQVEFIIQSLVAYLTPDIVQLAEIANETQGMEEERMSLPIAEKCAALLKWACLNGDKDSMDQIYGSFKSSVPEWWPEVRDALKLAGAPVAG